MIYGAAVINILFSMSQPNPRAQVPGYCGYIPGKNSENKFGNTFGSVTKGSYHTQPVAFLTTNINTNSFIQEQYTGDHPFWGNQGKLSGFNEPTQEPTKHILRHDVPSNTFSTQSSSLRPRPLSPTSRPWTRPIADGPLDPADPSPYLYNSSYRVVFITSYRVAFESY